jgi:hypothetical protein
MAGEFHGVFSFHEITMVRLTIVRINLVLRVEDFLCLSMEQLKMTA